MIKCSLLNVYFLITWIFPATSVFIYLFIPVHTVKVFGGNISDQSTRDAAQLWVRTTSNGDILVSLLSGIALFKQSDWHFRQIVIRVCSISNFVHFGCFLYHHHFVKPHHIGLVILYYSALSLTLLTGLGWGLNWNTILKKETKTSDELQLTVASNDSFSNSA
ncbi:unnamed protein product [Rotaria sp. Silwood1]|nr:unnamed protein product [Rotaria sp. Silwood1]CAF3427694.1 unnamed protein product [Rotaria sp. Silwood1]CAF3433351.1 unnamed protein product [Rotaria sp. Silwood1]CAF4754343.1 unnamed protein product [Rotaria sp. Silwood1]CAF4813830.1 unnamed protein product [Rotaria sp. Silwood1]